MAASVLRMVVSIFVAGVLLEARASDADIQALAVQVSQQSYTSFQQAVENMGLGRYAGPLYNQGTRGRAFSGKSGDKGNQEARRYIADQLLLDGLSPAIQGHYFNVVAEQTGTLTPENVFILAAHYDTKKSSTPGGDGDSSGVAGVLEAARVLSQYKFASTIRFIAFDGSEKTFHGSNDYALKILGIGKEKLAGLIDLNQILHPAHDKNPALPPALAIGLGTKESAALEWASAFSAAAQQFVPALPLESTGPVIDIASDHYSFVLNGYIQALRLSENSGKDQANAAIGTAADAGDGTAGKNYDFTFAANVVRAAVAMLGQQAGFVGTAGVPAPLDSDGDGYSDEIETALASDPASADSTPLNLPPAVYAGALETSGMTVGLDFSTTGADALAATGVLPIPDGFSPKDVVVIVDMGGVVKSLTLGAAGSGIKGNNTFTLKLKLKNGVAAAQLAPFTFSFSAGNFKRPLANFGLLNSDRGQRPVTVPLTVILNNEVRSTSRILLYAASKNISGVAK